MRQLNLITMNRRLEGRGPGMIERVLVIGMNVILVKTVDAFDLERNRLIGGESEEKTYSYYGNYGSSFSNY